MNTKTIELERQLIINGDAVTIGDLAQAWLQKQTRFTDAPWSDPSGDLTAEQYAQVSLIDLNESGADKTKANIKLPIRSRPGGPVNRNALRAAAAALAGARGGVKAPDEAKRKAARTIVRLMREAGIEAGPSILRIAGMASKGEWQHVCEIVKADEEKQLLYGVVLQPDEPDSQRDIVKAEDIELAAHRFMINSRVMDLQHERPLASSKAMPVESYIALTDFSLGDKTIKKGSWVLVTKIFDPDIWSAVKDGRINAYSITGTGQRRPARD